MGMVADQRASRNHSRAAANRLGMSHSTVKHHLANARSKVGATTTAQLVWILAERLPEPEGVAPRDEEQPTRSWWAATVTWPLRQHRVGVTLRSPEPANGRAAWGMPNAPGVLGYRHHSVLTLATSAQPAAGASPTWVAITGPADWAPTPDHMLEIGRDAWVINPTNGGGVTAVSLSRHKAVRVRRLSDCTPGAL